MKLDIDTLKRVSPLLDEVLDLERSQREEWLARLETTHADLAPIVRELLAKESSVETNDFLQRGPDFTGPNQDAHRSEFAAGDSIGPYRLSRELGVGGMGEVWLAERADGVLKRSVALKLPVRSLRRSILMQRFERERDILGSLAHPNIARLYDAGFSDSGQPYLALEYVEGKEITDYATTKGLDPRARIALLLQVMEAVQYAHANLVIHRDLKPSNVLVTAQGKALLLDFGIAKLLAEDNEHTHETELTRLGGNALTLQYAAPEQVSGLPISIAADIWALGVLLYQLLADQRPFEKFGRSDFENALRTVDPVRPSQCKTGQITKLPRTLASDLDTIVLKALKKSPSDRYSTVSAFSDDLKRWLNGEAVLARPDSRWYRTRKFVGRHRIAFATATVALNCIIATAAIAVWMGLQAREESDRAVAARNFLIQMFRQADPESAHGHDISAKQILDDGASKVLSMTSMPPLLQVELLSGIADAQADMGEYLKAEATLSELMQRYKALGQSNKLGEALIKRASVVYIAGNAQRAEPMLLEAGKLLRDEQAHAIPLVRLYQLQSSIDLSKGNLPEARKSSLKALDLARQTFGVDDEKSIQALATVARIEGADSDYNTASNHFDEAIERAGRVPTMHPRKQIWMRMERAQLKIKAGQLRVAADELTSLADRCEKVLERKAVTCTSIRRAEAAIWLDLGFARKANDLLPTFVARIDNQESPQDQVEALLTACRILLHNGTSQDHRQWWDQLREFAKADNDTKIPERYKYSAMLLLASRLLHDAQPTEAVEILDVLEKRYTKAQRPMDQLRSQIYLYRGIAEHQRGHYEVALDLLKTAATAVAKKQNADHPRVVLQSVLQAKTLWALRRPAEALAVLDHATGILQGAMGADAPKLQIVHTLRKQIGGTKLSSTMSVRQPDLFY